MNRKSLAIMAIFLIQSVATSQQGLSADSLSLLNPPTKVNAAYPDICFEEKYGLIRQAIFIYNLDVLKRVKKENILKEYEASIYGMQEIRFDIENINLIPGKGFTRYYPVWINGHLLTLRMFLTEEGPLQAKIQPIHEWILKKLTIQVLPGPIDIMDKIKPHRIDITAYKATSTSP